MSDAFVLKKLNFDLLEIEAEIQTQADQLNWLDNQSSGHDYKTANDGRYHTGNHGTKWCEISLSAKLINKLESSATCTVHRDVFYLWDYGSKVKSLPIHIDTAEINKNKVVAVCIPLVGRFHIYFYSDFAKTKPVGDCIYGPGDLILLNNRKYYHEGTVLDETRLALHFFLDFENDTPNANLKELLLINQLVKRK